MSLLKAKVIGVGAAGNKAAIDLIESGIIDDIDTILVNSTIKDIPEKYRNISIVMSTNAQEGCGKERNIAKRLASEAIQNGILDLDGFITKDVDLTILIGSTEGGTGSGSIPMMASYIRNFIDNTEDYEECDEEYFRANVHVVGLKGFGIDGRAFQNSIEFLKEIEETFTVEIIDNKKFLDEAKKDKTKAEKLANQELCRRVSTLLGQRYIDASQNIDRKDQYKAATMPGFITIEHYDLIDKIKNVQEFNDICVQMVDNTKSVSLSDTQKRLAVILNIPKSCEQYIDTDFEVLKEKLGFPYEVFHQIQYIEDSKQEAYIEFISSGMNMPIEELEKLYEEYKAASSKVNKAQDNFFDLARKITGNAEDDMFNGDLKTEKHKKDKSAFFAQYSGKKSTEKKPEPKQKDPKKTDKF